MNILEQDEDATPPPRRAMSLKKLRSPKNRSKRSSTVSAQESTDLSSSDCLGFPLERKAISLSNNAIPVEGKDSDGEEVIAGEQDRRVSDPATPSITFTNSVGCMAADQLRKLSEPEPNPSSAFPSFSTQELDELQAQEMTRKCSPSRSKRPPMLGAIDEKSQQSIDALYI
jgi:hypothetical protein